MATCYHCKQPINKRKRHTYVGYWLRRGGPMHKRFWCSTCADKDDGAIVDKEYPKSWDDALE